MTAAIIVGLLVAVIMLVPIGRDYDPIRMPDGTGGVRAVYWSLGSGVLFDAKLNVITVAAGIVFALGGGRLTYLLGLRLRSGKEGSGKEASASDD